MQLTWILKPFRDLSINELYELLRLRSEVFIVEQNCVFLDQDNKDKESWHLMGWYGNELIAYVRILPPGLVHKFPSIGRVVTSLKHRGMGAGRELMNEAIKRTQDLFAGHSIQIGAQLYLKKFYQSLGFEQSGEIYLDDGIEHIEMILPS
jgi:ElaA protein